MIATITKRFVTIGTAEDGIGLVEGMEVDVYPDKGSTLQVQRRDPDGTLHVVYNVQANWFASIAVYRRAKDLGYDTDSSS